MEYALFEGSLIHADKALRKGAYFCHFCKKPVFPKLGDNKARHFAHYHGDYHCEQYRQAEQKISRYRTQLDSYFAYLSDDEYTSRWNEIVRFVLQHHLELYYHDFPRIAVPMFIYAITSKTITKGEEQGILVLLQLLGADQVIASIERSRFRTRIVASPLFKSWSSSWEKVPLHSTQANVNTAPPKKQTGQWERVEGLSFFNSLSRESKFRYILKLLNSETEEINSPARSRRHLLDHVRFTHHSFADGEFCIPFDAVRNPGEYLPILRSLKQLTVTSLSLDQRIPTEHRDYLREFVRVKFSYRAKQR